MTVRLHIERVVVNDPESADPTIWRASLERELTVALAGTGWADDPASWPAGNLASLPATYLPARDSGPAGVVAAVRGSLANLAGGRS